MATSVGVTDASTTSFWIKFFRDAGIPVSEATNYAITFVDNRIQRAMLLDLTKEYLHDMGITVLGDVIAILKHAKIVHAEDTAAEKATRAASFMDTPTSSPKRRQTAASRTVAHYLGSDPDLAPMNAPMTNKGQPKMSRELALRLGATPSPSPVPVAATPSSVGSVHARTGKINLAKDSKPAVVSPPSTGKGKIRRVLPEHEGQYKVIMPSGTTEKTRQLLRQQGIEPGNLRKTAGGASVFSRLGGNDSPQTEHKSSPTITVTGLGKVKLRSANLSSQQNSPSVFNRLGAALKRPATSTSTEPGEELSDDDDQEEEDGSPALEYAGILKSSRKPAKKIAIKRKPQSAPAGKCLELRLGPAKEEPAAQTEGIFSPFAKRDDKIVTVKKRLGGKATVMAATTTTPTLGPPKAKSMKTSITVKKDVHTRLGPQKSEVSSSDDKTGLSKSSTVGVFGRLGKQISH